MHRILYSSQSSEWYTPPWVVARVTKLLDGIDIDPASNCLAQEIVQAAHWCGLDHPDPSMRDGLQVDWSIYRSIFVNPPYGKWLPLFAKKIVQYAQTKPMAVLVPARTDTTWWRLLTQHHHVAVFFRQRLQFWSPEGMKSKRPTFPSALLCYNCAIDRVIELFHDQQLYRPVV